MHPRTVTLADAVRRGRQRRTLSRCRCSVTVRSVALAATLTVAVGLADLEGELVLLVAAHVRVRHEVQHVRVLPWKRPVTVSQCIHKGGSCTMFDVIRSANRPLEKQAALNSVFICSNLLVCLYSQSKVKTYEANVSIKPIKKSSFSI